MIAAAATFIWWNTPSQPFVNNLALNLMVVCSVSTVLFNGNPLMRYDGYYMLADMLEIPNLRDRANKYLQNLAMEYCLGIEVPPEQYMELGRRVLFVTFAVVSYIYRWVVTFMILKFMATFLKPYKLEVISELLAVGALGSMIGWPLYRLIKNVKKRGRLPDMKPIRVTLSACLVAMVILVVLFVPLPVSRIRQSGYIEPTEITRVSVEVPGLLKELLVSEGQFVKKGKELARFVSLELETKRDEALAQMRIKEELVRYYDEQIAKEQDPAQAGRLREQRGKTFSEWKSAIASNDHVAKEMKLLVLRAPRDGVVIGLPQIDEIGKRWDREQNTLFCSIGDKTKLRMIVPLSAADYNLLRDNLNKERPNHPLTATIRVQGHDSKTWQGRIGVLPKSDAKTVPIQLSTKAGGPLAVKPGSNPNELVPQNQVFLVPIDLIDPDDSIALNSYAQVKIHCEYHSCAWYIHRTIASTFDLGLMMP
jgi:putative peptide zinc metalloprotease protein